MKATISPPVERTVTVEMAESEAHLLREAVGSATTKDEDDSDRLLAFYRLLSEVTL